MALGARHSGLGVDAALGVRAYSINDKIRIGIIAAARTASRGFARARSRVATH